MPSYNFKRDCKVYIVNGTSKFKVEVYPDLNFSQTFDEQAISVKTLHDQTGGMFDDAVINKANPANFNFTVLLTKGSDFILIGDLLTVITTGLTSLNASVDALLTFDLYVDTGVEIFKIEKCVLERGTFQINRDQLVTVSVSGTGCKLTRFGISGTVIPGTTRARESTVTAIIPRITEVTLDSQPLPYIAGISLEVVNEVSWIDYNTLHKSLNVTNASDTMYPEAFVVSKRSVTGNIQQYVTDETSTKVNTWSTNSTLRIRVGEEAGVWHFDANLPKVAFTNRIDLQDVIIQTYDFRMSGPPNLLTTAFGSSYPLNRAIRYSKPNIFTIQDLNPTFANTSYIPPAWQSSPAPTVSGGRLHQTTTANYQGYYYTVAVDKNTNYIFKVDVTAGTSDIQIDILSADLNTNLIPSLVAAANTTGTVQTGLSIGDRTSMVVLIRSVTPSTFSIDNISAIIGIA